MFPSNTDFETNVTLENVKRETETSPLPEDMPFHILLLGDWSGNENHSKISDLSLLKPIEIDRDNFDDVLKKLKVKLNLDFNGKGNNYLSLSFNELEDFHPDRIFQQVSLFADLREVRQRLKNSDTFNDAAREVRSWLSGNKENDIADISETFSVEINNTSQNDLLDQILGQADETFSGTQYTNTKPTELNNLIKDLVHPYLINIDTTEQANLLMIVDEVISDLMRKILHHPEFQSLESAWRGAYFLIRRIEMDSQLKIYLLDVTKEELIVNLKEINSLQDSGFYKILTLDNKQSSDYKSWALVCANYTFSLNVDDVAALIRIAKIAANTNTPFISHINPEMFKINAIDNSENSNKCSDLRLKPLISAWQCRVF
jgi:type VI secretion system protein ImpC